MFDLFKKEPPALVEYFTCLVEEMSFKSVNHQLKWTLWKNDKKFDKNLWGSVHTLSADTTNLYPSQTKAGEMAQKRSSRGVAGAAFYKEDGKLKAIVSAVR